MIVPNTISGLRRKAQSSLDFRGHERHPIVCPDKPSIAGRMPSVPMPIPFDSRAAMAPPAVRS